MHFAMVSTHRENYSVANCDMDDMDSYRPADGNMGLLCKHHGNMESLHKHIVTEAEVKG